MGEPGTSAQPSPAQGPKGRRMRHWLQGLLVIVVGVGGFGILYVLRASPEQVDPPRQIPTVSVIPTRIGEGPIRVRGGGTVRPSAETTVAPQVGGRVSWVSSAFVSGGRFAEGQALLRVDPADYENAVDAAEADVAQREVSVLEAEEEVRVALDEWNRLVARENLDPNPASALVTRQPQLDAANAALKSAEARLDDARLALDRTWIRAPFDGIVRDETVDLGQFVSPGQNLGSMYATDQVEIVVPLSDNEAALISELWNARAGDTATRIPVEIKSEYGGAEYVWTGYVDRAEAALDEQTRTVDVIVRVPRPFQPTQVQPDRPPLLIGGYATADIEGTSFDRFAVIPAAGLRDGDLVWTVVQDTLLRMVPVEPIQEVDDEVIVLAPLEAGDLIIVSALPFVTDGMTVRLNQLLESAPPLSPAASAGAPEAGDGEATEVADEGAGPAADAVTDGTVADSASTGGVS